MRPISKNDSESCGKYVVIQWLVMNLCIRFSYVQLKHKTTRRLTLAGSAAEAIATVTRRLAVITGDACAAIQTLNVSGAVVECAGTGRVT